MAEFTMTTDPPGDNWRSDGYWDDVRKVIREDIQVRLAARLVAKFGPMIPDIRIRNTRVILGCVGGDRKYNTKVTVRVCRYSGVFVYSDGLSERLWAGLPIDQPEVIRLIIYQLLDLAVKRLQRNYPTIM